MNGLAAGVRKTLLAYLLIFAATSNSPVASQSHMDKLLFLELANSQDSEAWGLLLVNLKGVLAGLEAANMTFDPTWR